MVGEEDIANAVSLNSSIINLAKIIGPAIAGLFMLHFGVVLCFFVNALSYIAVIGGLFLIKIEKAHVRKEKPRIMQEVFDGLRYIKGNQVLMICILIFGIVSTFAMNNDVIVPVFAQEVLGEGAGGYSNLLTAAGIGSLVAALFMASRSKNGVNKNFLVFGALSTALLQVLTVFTANYYISLVLLAAIGFVNIVFFNTANAMFQLNSPDEYRARVMSVYSLLAMGSTPVGNFLTGAVMDSIGGDSGFLFCGIVTLALLAPVFVFKRKPISAWVAGSERYLEGK
jgi:predicted MFS family arabinose efflux permease